MNEHDRTADDASHRDPDGEPESAPDSAPESPADNRWAPAATQEPAATPVGEAQAPELVEPAPVEPLASPTNDADVHDPAVRDADGQDAHPAMVVDDARGASSVTGTSPLAETTVASTEPTEPTEPTASSTEPTASSTPSTSATPATAAAPQVVYVPSPTPPRKKGNRGMGVGIALASTPIFAVVFAAISLLFVAIANGGIVASEAIEFFLTPSYYLPIVAFAVFYVLLALIVNRAGWWAHVLGGFVVAVLVYLVFVLSTAITAEALGVPLGQVQQLLLQQLTNPLAFAAAIAAREVPIWVGSLVARRGRTVKSRNVDAREAYDREREESREARPAAV